MKCNTYKIQTIKKKFTRVPKPSHVVSRVSPVFFLGRELIYKRNKSHRHILSAGCPLSSFFAMDMFIGETSHIVTYCQQGVPCLLQLRRLIFVGSSHGSLHRCFMSSQLLVVS